MLIRRVDMRKFSLFLLAFFLCSSVGGNNSFAGSTSSEIKELKKQIQQLQDRIEEIELKNQETNQKLEETMTKEQEKEEGWVEDIKGNVKKGTGLTWSTTDGNYKIRMRLRGQFLASVIDRDDENTVTEFRVPRVRIAWDGNAFRPWFKYKFQLDASDFDAELRDLIFAFAYDTRAVPTVGQMKVPFDRETLNSSSALQFITRSVVAGAFTWARDRGVVLNGVLGDYLTYSGGIFNGEGRNSRERDDSNLLWAGRVMFTPCCGRLKYSGASPFPSGGDYKIVPNFAKTNLIEIGAAISGLNVKNDRSDNGDFRDRLAQLGTENAQVAQFTTDISLQIPRANLEASYVGRWINPDDTIGDTAYDQGFRVQAGVFIIPKTLELAARYAYVDFDDGAGVVLGDNAAEARESIWQITPAINYYLSKDHRWKLQFSYNFLREEFIGQDDIDSNTVSALLQAYF